MIKRNTTGLEEILEKVNSLSEGSGSGNLNLQYPEIIPSMYPQIIYPDEGYDALGGVYVYEIPVSEVTNSAGGTTVYIAKE